MRDYLRRVARRSKTLIVAYKIYDNWRIKRALGGGRVETLHGSSHIELSTDESLAYINEQFEDYLRYAGLSQAQLHGKRVLEIGCGDNVGLALKFLAAGAACAVCLDKFYSKRDMTRQQKIYLALRDTLSQDQRRRFDEAISLEEGIDFYPNRLRVVYGTSLEQAAAMLDTTDKHFDIVISRAVLEEIWDLDTTFREMDSVLAPGGYTLHKIDLSDYGIFSDAGMHPLTFLTIPDSVYSLMATHSGIPNRKLISYYRLKMKALGYEARFFTTRVIGREELIPHKESLILGEDYSAETKALIQDLRPRLSQEFRQYSDENLMVSGVFMIARKPWTNSPSKLQTTRETPLKVG